MAGTARPAVAVARKRGLAHLFFRLARLPVNYWYYAFMHLACLAVLIVGVSVGDLLLCLALYLVRMFAVTAGYHRLFAHRSYKTSRVFAFLLGWVGCTAMQKGPLWWAANHRRHHSHSDTPEDVHSPNTHNLWWSHIGWVLEGHRQDTDWALIRDWSGHAELRWLNRAHWVPVLGLAALCLALGGWSGLVWGLVVSTVLLYHATFTINSLAHRFGSVRYATGDGSCNNWVLAWLTLGEGWHNNHHHYPKAVNQGFFWWEVDVTYCLLALLSRLGIVWDLHKPPAHVVQAERADSPAG